MFFSEASLTKGGTDKIKTAIEALRAKGLIYEGRLEKPKGHEDEEWEEREQTLFKSTEFGDEADRALMKSDGSYTYFAGDVAYHYDKLQRGYQHLVNVFGADHIGYIPRMLAVVAAFAGGTVERDAKGKLKSWNTTGGTADLGIKVVNLVKLFKNGEPYKMSKRAGTFVTLRDVVDEVGRDPVRFMMLYRKELEPLDFDFAKVTEQSKDNPVFYVQYAHARAASVFRNAQEVFPDLAPGSEKVRSADLSKLTDAGEIELIKKLAYFPRLIRGAAQAEEPHRLAFYLYDLASALHGQWSRGNDLPQLRFIQADDGVMTAARLALIAAVQQVISSGLSVLGVEAPDSMRVILRFDAQRLDKRFEGFSRCLAPKVPRTADGRVSALQRASPIPAPADVPRNARKRPSRHRSTRRPPSRIRLIPRRATASRRRRLRPTMPRSRPTIIRSKAKHPSTRLPRLPLPRRSIVRG